MDFLKIEGLPAGVRLRNSVGEADYPGIVACVNRNAVDMGLAPGADVDLTRLADRSDPEFDVMRDRIIVEADGQIIGLARAGSGLEPDGTRIYWHGHQLLREWRGRGIEAVLCELNERRLREIAQRHLEDKGRLLRSGTEDTQTAAMETLAARGYAPIRHGFHMVRPHLEGIPEAGLPEGVVARPVREGEERAIWDANLEAFRDHWGYQEPPANGFEVWRENPMWDRGLSRVAWARGNGGAGEEVAGMVLVYVPRALREGKRTAETEQICVRRRWRRKGVASALIGMCLRALREAGFEEAELGVDSQNENGALQLYERMGYEVRRRYTQYQREFPRE